MKGWIFGTYNNYVSPHGFHIHKTASDIAMNLFSLYIRPTCSDSLEIGVELLCRMYKYCHTWSRIKQGRKKHIYNNMFSCLHKFTTLYISWMMSIRQKHNMFNVLHRFKNIYKRKIILKKISWVSGDIHYIISWKNYIPEIHKLAFLFWHMW